MNDVKPLYFDHNATTPVHDKVFRAMRPFLTEKFGNPGSPHHWGLEAREALEEARANVASLINADPEEIFFTSCATESNNMVLFGTLGLSEGRFVTSAVEHPAILEPAKALRRYGLETTLVPVDENGLVDPEEVIKACRRGTKLVSIMLANNEVGAIQPVQRISSMLGPGTFLHSDAAQAVGKIPVDVKELGLDFMTIAGHKLYAPKGVGALYVRKGLSLPPHLYGGGQEYGLKSGTENVAFAVALGAACLLAKDDLEEETRRQRDLGLLFLAELDALGHDYILHAQNAPRLPNTMSIGFRNLPADRIVEGLALADVGVSPGAACHSTDVRISHVLEAMEVPREYALGTIRFSWGRSTTAEDVRELGERLGRVIRGIRPVRG